MAKKAPKKTVNKAYKRPQQSIPRVGMSHEQDWVRCCKSGKQPGANFDYSGPLTEACQLGNLAKRFDTRIQWDGPSMKVTNLPEENNYVCKQYRKGWTL